MSETRTIPLFGKTLVVDEGDALNLLVEPYEPYQTELVRGLVRPGDAVVDVGAMIGYYTIIFAELVGEGGHVWAFEPDPDNFALLEENVRRNDYADRVTLVQAAVSERRGRARLFRNTENLGDHRLYDSGDGRPSLEVDVVALDDVVAGPVDLVKIDAQGGDARVVGGMTRLLDRSPRAVLLVEFCPYLLLKAGSDPAAFVCDLEGRGFAVWDVDESEGRLRRAGAQDLLARYRVEHEDRREGYTNLLCVRTVW